MGWRRTWPSRRGGGALGGVSSGLSRAAAAAAAVLARAGAGSRITLIAGINELCHGGHHLRLRRHHLRLSLRLRLYLRPHQQVYTGAKQIVGDSMLHLCLLRHLPLRLLPPHILFLRVHLHLR